MEPRPIAACTIAGMTDDENEWEIVYTLRARVRARTAVDALAKGPKIAASGLRSSDGVTTSGLVDVTDVRVFRYDEQHRLASLIEVMPDREPRSKNSPIEILREKARAKCTWCWHNFWCAKDPEYGWVHIDKDEYRWRGKPAIHKCEAPEISDQMLELEEAERNS